MPRLLPRFLGNGTVLGLLLAGCGSGPVSISVPVDAGVDGDATTAPPPNPCGDAKVCDAAPLPMGCDGGSCVPPESVGAGKPCTFTADCKAGYYCGADGTCDAAGDGGAGATCATAADCVRGAVCYRATPGLYGVCAAPDGTSIAAECDGGCDAGLASGGKGTAQGLGGTCKTVLDCQAGLACDPTTSTCEPGVPGQGLPLPWGGVTCTDANGADAGATVRAYFEVPAADGTPPNDFFRLPFPNDIRRDPTTHLLNLTGFPTPGSAILGYDLVKLYVEQSEKDLDGFGTNQYVYFRFSSGIDLDTLTVGTGGTVQSYDLTVGAATDSISFSAGTAGDHYICGNNVKVTAGVLLPGHTYAVTLGAGLKDNAGHAVVADASFPAMLASTAPTSASLKAGYAAYAPLRAFLATQQVDPSTILDAAVFTTESATSEVSAMRTAVLAGAAPVASGFVDCSTGGVSPCDDGLTGALHVRGCVGPFNPAYDELEGEITLPIMQAGTRPYTTVGQGAIATDATGAPIIQGTEKVCVSLTVPHGVTAPAAGWPVVVYAHGTGGDYLSGLQEGLALAATNVSLGGSTSAQFAFLGYDGVMTGPRRGAGVTQSPDTLFFNFANPVAARDNVLQGAADVYALVRAMGSVSLTGLPTTGTTTTFDATRVYFLGHSQGSTVGLPASVFEPGLAGMVYSGAGGDLRQSLLTKTDPVDIAALTPYLLEDTDVDVTHPALNMFQAFFERADAVNYGGLLSNLPTGIPGRPFVQTYGLGDTYAPIPTLQALASAIGEPATGPVVGAKPWPTSTGLTLPVNDDFGTTSGMVTAGLLEADPMGAYDGHFVLFDDPTIEKRVMQFLGTAATGTATIE